MFKFLNSKSNDKEAFLIVVIAGICFGLGALFYEFNLKIFVTCFLFGLYSGFAALPYIDSEKWSPKPLVCAILGMIGACAFGLSLDWSLTHIALLGLGGLVFGYFAPIAAEYV